MCNFIRASSKCRPLFCEAIALCALLSTQAQICTLCPADATDTAMAAGFTLAIVRDGVTNFLASGAPVEIGETVILRANVRYNPIGSTGGTGAGFSGGSGHMFVVVRGDTTVHEHIADVTPADMTNTLVGPASCAGAVIAKQMIESTYTITPADVAAGLLRFRFEFTNGLSALQNPISGECVDHVEASPERIVSVIAGPTCSIEPPSTNICQGTSASFTASGSGPAPYDFIWNGPNGFTQADSNVLSSSITISHAHPLSAGTYTAMIVDSSGHTNTCPATLIIDTPHRATATAQLVNGFVVGATITDAGCGYSNAPTVLFQGGGGNGAGATAIIADGRVIAIQITNAGCCYTNTPEIVIDPPPVPMATVSIAVSKVKVTQHVLLGWRYVLESSTDNINWTPAGPEFTAESETIVTEFDVDTTGRFFRLRVVP